MCLNPPGVSLEGQEYRSPSLQPGAEPQEGKVVCPGAAGTAELTPTQAACLRSPCLQHGACGSGSSGAPRPHGHCLRLSPRAGQEAESTDSARKAPAHLTDLEVLKVRG